MALLGLEQVQKTSQIQTQRLSQYQIQVMNMIGMSSQDLRSEILREVEENPALELVSDSFSEGTSVLRKKNEILSNVRQGTATAAGVQASQDFQAMMESAPAPEQTLQEHLIQQLNVSDVSDSARDLCEKIIQNLDSNGFYILSPEVFLEPQNPQHTRNFLSFCIQKIRTFDPVGICVKDVQESLLVQAKSKKQAPALALFILDGHLDFIMPPSADKARKKILDYSEEQKKLSFAKGDANLPEKKQVTLSAVEEAIKFIQTLDPYPARGFGVSDSRYIRPDVYVTHEQGILENDDMEKGLVSDGESYYFCVIPANDTVPVIRLARDFQDAAGTVTEKEQKFFVKSQIKAAEAFIDSINFRNRSIITACTRLVKLQLEFFRKGPGHMIPLTQRQFAEEAGIHESTVSRIADSKFIHCDWGTFPIKYFFSNAIKKAVTVEAVRNNDTATEVSSDSVRLEIEKILRESETSGKKLSDQKIADLLSSKGYKIARRTVSKYRSQLNIASSYVR